MCVFYLWSEPALGGSGLTGSSHVWEINHEKAVFVGTSVTLRAKTLGPFNPGPGDPLRNRAYLRTTLISVSKTLCRFPVRILPISAAFNFPISESKGLKMRQCLHGPWAWMLFTAKRKKKFSSVVGVQSATSLRSPRLNLSLSKPHIPYNSGKLVESLVSGFCLLL